MSNKEQKDFEQLKDEELENNVVGGWGNYRPYSEQTINPSLKSSVNYIKNKVNSKRNKMVKKDFAKVDSIVSINNNDEE